MSTTIHMQGFVGDDDRPSIEASICDGTVREVAEDVMGIVRKQGHVVTLKSHMFPLGGGEDVERRYEVEIMPGIEGSNYNTQWHIFKTPREPWPRQWTPNMVEPA